MGLELVGSELHELWERLQDTRRLGFLDSLNDEAADRLIRYQVRQKVQGASPPERATMEPPCQLEHPMQSTPALRPRGAPLLPCDDPELAERREQNRAAVARYRERGKESTQ